MSNSPRNIPGNSTEKFQQALKTMKEFILDLIKRKKERVEQEIKDKIDDIIPSDQDNTSDSPQNELEKKGWFDKLPGVPSQGKDETLETFDQGEESIQDDEQGSEGVPEDESLLDSGEADVSAPKQEQHFQDQDEYIPQDVEFGEAMGSSPRFAEIYPPYRGYYVSGRKSYFDPKTNLWSKRKQLRKLDMIVDISQQKHVYAGVMPAGLVAIPLPEGSLPDMRSVVYNGATPPVFKIDQNNCLYIESYEQQYISFNFHRNQNIQPLPPISADSEKIIYSSLSPKTQNLLDSLKGSSSTQSANIIREYIIKTKNYSTKQQGTLRNKSNSSNYLSHLDASPILECFSTASLFAGMCRELGIPCRVVTGHMSEELDNGKSLLGSNNGHAWNEFWDEVSQKWIRIDATPQKKEKDEGGDTSEQSSDRNESLDSEESSDPGESSNQQSDDSSQGSDSSQDTGGKKDDQGSSEQSSESGEQGGTPKSPREALEELIEQAKEDSLSAQAEELKETIEKLEDAGSKEDIRDILDDANLSDFAKDMIDEIGNEEILQQEQDQIDQATDELEIEQLEENSLLDDEYKKKLSEYAKIIRKKLEEEKKRQKSKMERMGFKEDEFHLFQTYIALEKEVAGEVRSQIKALEKILPKQYHTVQDNQNHYRSGGRIGNTGKLIEHTLTGDPNVFRRNKKVRESNEINMFETIIIDRSGSMGNFDDPNSPMRASIKAAIIRAKVLEHFKVEFSILLFDDNVEEIMAFGETYTDKRLNTVPSRLMRALEKSGGTNIGEPLAYTLGEMEAYRRKTKQKSFGNISFIGDGRPLNGLTGDGLTALIDEIRNRGYGLTAYYIGGSSQDKGELEGYFGKEQDGGTVIVSDIGQLTQKLIGSYNKGLRNIVRKYSK